MRNYLKLGILLFGISLLLWNCEKEEFIQSETSHKKLKTKRVNIEDIPNIASILSKNGKTIQGRTTQLSCGNVNLNNIIEVINEEDGKTNYTFSFIHNSNEEEAVLYNYVIFVLDNDNYSEYIVKYTPDTNFLNNYSIYNNSDINNFTGKMEIFLYDSFCSSSKKSKNTTNPCNTIEWLDLEALLVLEIII